MSSLLVLSAVTRATSTSADVKHQNRRASTSSLSAPSKSFKYSHTMAAFSAVSSRVSSSFSTSDLSKSSSQPQILLIC
ncbi:hypothetical protein PIB30_028568 [Stylosanthes scabra]|uniref:Secreted protein n=1 Tax=Stylosanthes scabra TaxID=79078 RepID=A0ABU6UCS3_9FABA|nr:hypothetical protein [Stylosanthes scabra]